MILRPSLLAASAESRKLRLGAFVAAAAIEYRPKRYTREDSIMMNPPPRSLGRSVVYREISTFGRDC